MSDDDFRLLIERGDPPGLERALASNPSLANRTIRWSLNQTNESDPLHYVSDCVGNGWLTNVTEGQIAELLLAHGAKIDGMEGRESPLIAAASLGAEKVAAVLIEQGANLEATSLFGARALHWAAWMGMRSTVEGLIAHGAELEPRCSEFGATPLFWGVQGYGPKGPKDKRDPVGAVRALIEAGARVDVKNKQGLSAVDLAKSYARGDLYEELLRSGRPAPSSP